ncbi:alpha/beta fold hydrolase [Verrucomicrobiota bacterium sgz303538]
MSTYRILSAVLALLFVAGFGSSRAQEGAVPKEPLGIALEGYPYPYPVAYLPLNIEGQDLRMAYMDIAPESGQPRGTVLLFHGKNFFGAYWHQTIRALTAAGFRVIVPDQIGFGKSSKPDIHYSFHLLAANTRKLLDELKVDKVAIVGHSMGGMLATRFALMYPDITTHLILENPIGLEDYRQVPYVPTEKLYEQTLHQTEEQLRKYQKAYYVEWKPTYDEYVQVQYRWLLGGEASRAALSSALTSQMIYEQPVCYEFNAVNVPTLLVIGQSDRTAIGKDRVSPEVAAKLGNYPELGKRTAQAIPRAKLVQIENVGHIPHFEAPERFHGALIDFLKGQNK